MRMRHLITTTAAALLLASPGLTQEASPAPFVLDDGSSAAPQAPAPRAQVSLNEADEAEMKALILDTLVANPDVLVQALQLINAKQVEARNAIAARESHIREVARNTIGAPVTGNPDGDISIIVFSDYNCTECREAYSALQEVVQADGNVRVVHRAMPILGAESMQAAKAALAADMQGKFAPFHAALIAATEPITTQTILKAALDSGVDLNKMLVDQDAEPITAQLQDTRAISDDFGFEGAPAFFIGTFVATGKPTPADLRDAISRERARSAGETPAAPAAD